MLPAFPHFTHLKLEHQHIFDDFTRNLEITSDYNFASLYSWDIDHKVMVATLNDNLVVQFSDYVTHEPFLSFIGMYQLTSTIDTLLAYNSLGHKLQFIPEFVIDALAERTASPYKITEDRDNFDYILSVEQLADLTRWHHKKRATYAHFMRTHGKTMTCHELDLTSPSTLNAIRKVFRIWQQHRHKSDADVQDERSAIERYLQAAHTLHAEGLGVYINNELVDFSLFDTVHPNVANSHFAKVDTYYSGMSEFLKYNLAILLASKKIEYINLEQDLGIAGLRFAKNSYQPVKLLKKYTITAK